jgi:hypothetical protein
MSTTDNFQNNNICSLNEFIKNDIFQMGYDDCMIEIISYLIENGNVDPQSPLLQQLFNYLIFKRDSL